MSTRHAHPPESWSIRLERYTFMRDGVTGVEFAIQAFWGDGEPASRSVRETSLGGALLKVAWLASTMEETK